ncbi:hypothetical protein ACP70R_017740 [Stipagrostis hirtigluma subsp. patula]
MLRPQLTPSNGGSTLLLLGLPSRLSIGRPRRGQILRRVSPEQGSEMPSSSGGAAYSAVAGRADDDGAAVCVVRAVATVKVTVGGFLNSLRPSMAIEAAKDVIRRSLYLELVSCELNADTGQEKRTIRTYVHRVDAAEGDDINYKAGFKFNVPAGFGPIGAVLVTNEHHTELFLEDVKLLPAVAADGDGAAAPLLTIRCKSWIQPKSGAGVTSAKRVFFANKAYLPNQTPPGLQSYRKKDLEHKRGDGRGERKAGDRVYDYDVYNDLGDPDNDAGKVRPVLGGSKQFPYPRRCRTGRPRSTKDPESETRSANIYVPRDEEFSEVKSVQFSLKTLRTVLPAAAPAVQPSTRADHHRSFPSFFVIDKLFEDGVKLPHAGNQLGFLRGAMPRLLRAIRDADLGFSSFFSVDKLLGDGVQLPRDDKLGILRSLLEALRDGLGDQVLRFDKPASFQKDKFAWLRDEEFAREMLAGVNPHAIELIKEFPIKSKLDPTIYGPSDSAITVKVLEEQMGHVMTVAKAMKHKRLFMLDYHDLFLPYVHKTRDLQNTTMYGSRTIFFLTDDGTLRMLAIELTRPASTSQPQWRRVFTPSTNTAIDSWLWIMAKSHVRAHDSGHHELIGHWLRTHCVVEPYIIATNRQLSEMHPIYQLLHPHFRYTLRINALARSALINADGIIEVSFSPQKYSMELSSVAYDQLWRFDMEALPADLIRRGMAEVDPDADHGLKLTIEDYPYANDGLLIWDAIKGWVQTYVSRFYPNDISVTDDAELQAFWTEVRTHGHCDKKNAPWWPKMDSPESLVNILTTIIWVASAQHAAVNFGQYDYGGYFPNRPSIARTNMPVEEPVDAEAFARFLENPDEALRDCFPSLVQATLVMATLDLLSSHSPDEEYLGSLETAPWNDDMTVKEGYRWFSARLKAIEKIINERNKDRRLKNRCDAGMMQYQLLKPFSLPGVTGMGIPNSPSI